MQQQLCVLYIDFAKACDTVPHDILIKKLALFGMGGKLLKLFISYLTDRTQFVQINNHESTLQKVTSSVPQGSILGPLLFLIFNNDLPDTMPQSDSLGYADDYKAIFSAQSGLDRAMDALAIWLRENKMSVDISKTNIMNLRVKMTASLFNQCLPVTDRYNSRYKSKLDRELQQKML